jgi:hypothetical protein
MMEMKLRWAIGVFFGMVVVSLCGCSEPVYPVKGKVTVNGKVLTEGAVTFWPDESKGNKSVIEARGTIGDDGTYELFSREKKGAVLGAYKVTITSQGAPVDSTKLDKAPPQLVPTVFTAKETTTLTKEVVATPAAGAYDLDVK